jgi:hypothetical protein
MLNRIARHTWLNCILFLIVYMVLFAVQVHFKYSIYHKNNSGLDLDATVINSSKGKCTVDRKIDINYKSNKLNVKVSKRYQHRTIYEFPLVTMPALNVFAGVTPAFVFSSARLCHSTLISSQHRGPPAIG